MSVGPVGVYGGGRRRRSRSSGGGGLWALFGLLLLIGLAIEYWYIAVPVAVLLLGLAFLGSRMQAKQKREEATRQDAEWRAMEAERQEAERERERRQQVAIEHWLAAPPPRLVMPGRFTQNWLAAHIPDLHPGQVPVLLKELHARGWTEERIEERVAPFLAENPHVERLPVPGRVSRSDVRSPAA